MNLQQALRFGCFLLLILGVSLSSHAQSETATLSGRVADPQGAVVPGARVEVTNILTNVSFVTETNSHGLYVVPNLRPGQYRVVVRKAGFNQVVRTGIQLHVQDGVVHNFSLNVGSLSQSVTVVAKGGGMSTSGAVSTVVDRQFVENLPLNGRSFQQLITLTPGVVLTPANFGSPGQFSVNGQRSNANYFTVDGVSANFGVTPSSGTGQSAGGTVPAFGGSGSTSTLVSVDAMQEFRIQTSTYAPEFGRQPGGQVSIVTRSGSNDFHGTLFEYFRNDKLDATDWFANNLGLEKPPLRQNDFGGVLGGPIVPDKTFFFFSYEGLRLRQPKVIITDVPSVASRQAAVPAMQPFLNSYPLPNGPEDPATGFAQFSGSFSDEITLDTTSVRIDHTFNDKWTLFGRYNHAPSDNAAQGLSLKNLSTLSVTPVKIQTLTLGATQIITPSVSNELRVNLSRTKGSLFNKLTDFGGAIPPPESVIFPSFVDPDHSLIAINIIGGRGARFNAGGGGGNQQRQVNLVDNLSATLGAHQLKFGVDYRWLSPLSRFADYAQSATFRGLTGPTGALGGIAASVSVRNNQFVTTVFNNFSAYAQDTWRVSPRLTLTYGLRWEVNPAPTARTGEGLSTVVGIDGDPANIALAPPGTSLYDTTYDNFAPRVGVAYQLSEKSGKETVLRGGFGTFYDLGASRAAGDVTANFPFSAQKSLGSVPFPLSDTDATPPPFPSNPVSASSTGFDADFKLPRTYQWNFALEQSLGSQTVSATYIGAVGRRLVRSEKLFFPNPSFFLITVERNAATSDYHALQLQFKRRLSKGLQALASYTWSHSIDLASSDHGGINAADFSDPNLDRGSSTFDVRHAFSAAVTYNIPSPAAGGFGRVVLRDWSIDTILTARSALPVDLEGGTIISPPFFVVPRPDLVLGEPLYLDDPTVAGGRRFNPGAFDGNTPRIENRQGTLGRNVLRGFGMWQVDLALRRRFNLTEKLNLQFRAEFFNLFNHPNFADPENSLSSSFFGESLEMLGRSLGTGTGNQGGFNPLYQVGGPRSMQFALKLVF